MTDWPEIIRAHSPMVWKISYRLLGNQADAAECLQEAFVSAVTISRRERIRNWPALLRRLAVTRAIGLLRRRLRQAGPYNGVADWMVIPCDDPGPGQSAENLELAARLRHALATLPPQQAAAVCLHHVEGMSYSETARALGVRTGTVGALLHRARSRMRELLAGTAVHGDK
jgi:RNA polymerase sigma-70 factor (ECF subfamily)